MAYPKKLLARLLLRVQMFLLLGRQFLDQQIMQKLFKIFVKRFLNLFLILIFSQSAVALEVYFKSASKSLDVEVANSDAKRSQGLMHRQDLAKRSRNAVLMATKKIQVHVDEKYTTSIKRCLLI